MKQILLSLLFLIIGVGLLVYSFYRIKDYNEKNKIFEETEARVVDHEHQDEDNYAIVVEYTVDGNTYRKTSSTSTNHPKSIGTIVKIKYNPENPEDMIWSNDSTNIIVPIVGVLFAGIGVYGIIYSIKESKKGA